MRNTVLFLALIGAVLLGIFVLLPVLGVLLVVVAVALVVGVGLMLAAPLLARLPWFRDRITVDVVGNRRVIRFGRGMYTYSESTGQNPYTAPQQGPDGGDVIDVEGRELPDKDEMR